LAALHVVGVVGMDREHGACDLRRDLHQVAADIGVVGCLVPATMQQPVHGVAGASQQEEADDADEENAALVHCMATCTSNPPPSARMRLMESASSRACRSARRLRCSSTCVSAVSTWSRLPMPAL